MPLPDNCCDCTCKSFCNESAAVIKYSDGTYDPPKVPRLVQRPGPDGTNVPQVEYDWLLYGPSIDVRTQSANIGLPGVNSEACVWNLVSGSHPKAGFGLHLRWRLPIDYPALEPAINALGLSVDDVYLTEPWQAVAVVNAAIASRTELEKAQAWNGLIAAGFSGLWPSPFPYDRQITLTQPGTILTRTTAQRPVHVVEFTIGGVARQAGDNSGTPYGFDPMTMDVLVGCDAQGASPQYTLRVRVEHGAVISPVTDAPGSTDPGRYINGFSSWDGTHLQSHLLIPHKDTFTGQFQSGQPISRIEARVFLEVLGPQGQAVESVMVPANNYVRDSFFGGLAVRWSWSHNNGQLHINAGAHFAGAVGDAEDANGYQTTFVSGFRVARHLFAPQASARPSFIGVKLTRAKRHSVTVRHRQFRIETTTTSNGLPLTPVIPFYVAPYCDPSHPEYAANQQPDRWPWRKTNCTVWRRHGGRVTQAQPQFSECLLTITVDPLFAGEWENTNQPLGTLIGGAYDLGKLVGDSVHLSDNYFWFDDEPDTSVALGETSTAYLRRIEFSLMVGAGLTMPPCDTKTTFVLVGGLPTAVPGVNWAVRGFLRGRAVIQVDNKPPMSRFFHASLELDDAFLRGTEVNAAGQMSQFGGVGNGPWMQWYFGGAGDPFVRPGGPGTAWGSIGDVLKPLSELKLQLVE